MKLGAIEAWDRFCEQVLRQTDWPRDLWLAAVDDALAAALPAGSELLEDYRQTVLQAQGEVENAIVAFFKSQQQLVSLQSAASAAQRAVDVSTVQYEGGEVPFNTVITTLQALVAQQDQLASIQGTVVTNLVALYKSLGGGWELRVSPDPLDMIDVQTRQEMLERTKYWNKTFEHK